MKKPNNGRWKKGQSGNPRGRPKGAARLAILWCRGTYHAFEQILEMIKSPETDNRIKLRASKEWLERSLGKVEPEAPSPLDPDGGVARVIILPRDHPIWALQPSAPEPDPAAALMHEPRINSKDSHVMKKPNNRRWKKGQSGNPRGRPKGTTRLDALMQRGAYHALEQLLEMIKGPETDSRIKFLAMKVWLERSLGKV
jgi:Family of unknown function (DUF5681)